MATAATSTILIETSHFLLRPLTRADISGAWAGWLSNVDDAYLLNAPPKALTTADLREYIAGFDNRARILLGIFHRPTGNHIGLLTAIASDSGNEVMLNVYVGAAQFRSASNFMEIKKIRIAVASYLFFERGFKQIFASVVAHNKVMVAYLRSAGYEIAKRTMTPSRTTPGAPPVEVLVFRLTPGRFLARNGDWVTAPKSGA